MKENDYTLYTQNGGYKSLGFNIDVLNNVNLAVPAGLLFLNNNFKKPQINNVKKGIVNSELYNTLKNMLKTKKLVVKKKNKTQKNKKKYTKRNNKKIKNKKSKNGRKNGKKNGKKTKKK
tara:strand:+ start:983 stop:1339 length:357 start_codon:yes stop_codon:yes gene_type:complete